MAIILITLAAVTISLLVYFIFGQLSRPKNFPPGKFDSNYSKKTFRHLIHIWIYYAGPYSYLPLIGNTPLLRKLAIECGGQHRAFEKLSKDYDSPVIGLKLGRELVIVAFTYPLVKEIHVREEFDGRPDNFFLRLRTMGTRWVLAL